MRSFRWQAQVWEEEELYDHKLQLRVYAHERRFIDQCFSEERTKYWSTRLNEYRDWRCDYRREPRPMQHDYQRQERLGRLPDGRQPGSLDEKFDAVSRHALLQACRRARRNTEFHGFMYLPRELRDLIYGYAVATGSRFVITNPDLKEPSLEDLFEDPNGYTCQRYFNNDDDEIPLRGRIPANLMRHRDPNQALGKMNLLRGVSYRIQREAAEVFFSRNQVVFTAGIVYAPRGFMYPINDRTDPMPIVDYRELARDVSYTFDMRDVVVEDFKNLYNGRELKNGVDDGTLQPREAMVMLHDQKCEALEYHWIARIDAIKDMTLDRLQLSFENCYCSMGCCRKVAWLLDAFIYDDVPPGGREEDVFSNKAWKMRPPSAIEVLGWRSEREKAMIEEKLALLKSPQPIDICFIDDNRDLDSMTV